MTPTARRPVLAWFRRDLRLTDNPAWSWAVRTGRPVIPVFVLDEEEAEQPIGGAARWWLHGSLEALDRTLRRQDSRLVLRRGNAGQALSDLARETGASTLVWNRLYEPAITQRDEEIEERRAGFGPETRTFQAGLLFEPEDIRSGTGRPYRVFAPFWRKCLERVPAPPVAAPPPPEAPAAWPRSDDLESWELRCHEPDWAAGFREVWKSGEEGARKRLRAFLAGTAEQYDQDRDRPGIEATSRLSPHLHFGEIGPRQVAAAAGALPRRPREAFLRELGWREFSYHLLFHNPEMGTRNLRPGFDRMPWRDAPDDLRRWQRGQTGYPIIDAGMRELWTTGWVHNRVRMLVGPQGPDRGCEHREGAAAAQQPRGEQAGEGGRDAMLLVGAQAPPQGRGRPLDEEARVSEYGYKNHVSVDRAHGLVRRYEVTDAACHDSQVFDQVLDERNTSGDVWADSPYRGEEHEEMLTDGGYRSRVHRKGQRDHPLPQRSREANRKKSRVRARVEHVFGHQEAMGGKLVRTVGLDRASCKIGMMNLVFNLRRFAWLCAHRPPRPALAAA